MAAKRKQFTIETKYQAILQVEKGVQKKIVAADLGRVGWGYFERFFINPTVSL